MNTSTPVYFYRPLPYFGGRILKCAGICTEDNLLWFTAANPGTVLVNGYRGDRVHAADLAACKGA